MKRKIFTLAMASFLLLSASAVQAQDRRSPNTEIQQDHEYIKERYEQRKRAIHDAYKRDMEAVDANSGLTAAQRKERRRVIQERFNQQKRELQAAYKADKKSLQAKRKSSYGSGREDRDNDRGDDNDYKNRDVKKEKALKKEKSTRGERSYQKVQGSKGKGQANSKSKGKRS